MIESTVEPVQQTEKTAEEIEREALAPKYPFVEGPQLEKENEDAS